MTMTRAGNRVSAVEIEIPLAVVGVDPDAFAAFGGDRHLFVGRELIAIFAPADIFQITHGFVPTSIKPVFSSNPNIKFMFCTACPAAPFTRLSRAEKTTSWRPRAAKPMSQKLVVLTQLMSGDPSTSRTKIESR